MTRLRSSEVDSPGVVRLAPRAGSILGKDRPVDSQKYSARHVLSSHLEKTSTSSFCQRAYGLRISTDVAILELPPIQARVGGGVVRASLARRFERLSLDVRWYLRARLAGGATWLRSGKIQSGYVLSFPGVADFLVDRRGREVVCRNASRYISLGTIRHLLIDHVLPLIVNLRGHEALHATAVATPGGVCAFTGPAGSGKSTLAASFVLSGYPLVCDDCMTLAAGKTAMAVAGYPGLRLWEDSIQGLGAASRHLKRVANDATKSRWRKRSGAISFCPTTRPLVRVYLLKRARGRSTRVVIRDVPPGRALMGLLEAAYRLDITDHAMLKRQFHFLSRIAERVPIKQLVVPDSFSALGDVKQSVLDDLAGDRGAASSTAKAQS